MNSKLQKMEKKNDNILKFYSKLQHITFSSFKTYYEENGIMKK